MLEKSFGFCPSLPEDIQPIFQNLCEDLASLFDKWHLYLDLFSQEETVALLNNSAMASFQVIEESLRSDITMSICRFCDRQKLSGKENLSIRILDDKLGHIPGLGTLLNDFLSICDPVIQYRNKRIGHNDLKIALKPHDNPLPSITRATINKILKAAADLMNHTLGFYENAEIGFDLDVSLGGGKDLVNWLRSAWEHYKEEQKKYGIK
ncbi:MAG: hypothetical protein LUQ65_01650 [Candidatus Helarchaeota archaeon]|nr:hypothetical protein [Candidatus Helarchaeota archaeon]